MKPNIKKICWIIILGILMLMGNYAHSGAPEGLWESIPPDVQRGVVVFLMQEGLCLNCDRILGGLLSDRDRLLGPKIIENEITTYLLDNRNLLTNRPIPKHRKVDVLICLMMRKGNTSISYYRDSPSFMDFCSIHLN